MCGLAGILSLSGAPVRHTSLRAMTDALRHRGPDEGAVVLLGDRDDPSSTTAAARGTRTEAAAPARLGLGHRRLKVIDLSGRAAQPMRSPSGSWLVYNGEIYNAHELRAQLEALGARFRSRSDTEVVLEALGAWGLAALARFNGMFALAHWDPRLRRLILARDRFGEKPLYYTIASGHLVFASELGALVRHGDVPLEIDPQAVELYLTFGFIPAPWSIYRGVRKLPHASYLEVRPDEEPRVARYYRLEDRRASPIPGRPDDAVRGALLESVGRRMEADVPLGAFLSGGLDSTAVVACMRLSRDAAPLTYSMGIPDLPYFDESSRARRTAGILSTLHHEVPVDAAGLLAEIPFVLGRLDEPFADSSALASSIISRAARRDLTVALSGDGGDELFGGYRMFRGLAAHGLLRRLPPRAAAAMGALLGPLPARHGGGAPGAVRQARRLLEGATTDLAAAHAAWMSVCGRSDRRALRPAVPDEDLGASLVEERYRRFGGGLDAALAVEVDLPLPDDMLAKVDRTSMAHALEVRAPFLDPALVELALSLPSRLHFGLFSGKRLLRRALQGLVPRHVLRAPKRGFEVPVGHWLSGPLQPLYREIVSPGTLHDLPGLEAGVAQAWLEEHCARARDHGRALWSLFALCFWMQGPHRAHAGGAREALLQLRGCSSSAATVLRSTEG
jgi:asparagine synthase (glutamine-hydrolysing)